MRVRGLVTRRGAVTLLVGQGGWEVVGVAVPAGHVKVWVGVRAGIRGKCWQKLQPHVLTVILLSHVRTLLVCGRHLGENAVIHLLRLPRKTSGIALLLRERVLDEGAGKLRCAAAAAGQPEHACI